MKKLIVLIFSMNRACQLEAFLRSMGRYFPSTSQCVINIYYKATTEAFVRGYDRLFYLYPQWRKYFIKQGNNIRSDLTDYLKNLEDVPYITFFCDDDIWKSQFSLEEKRFNRFENNPEILCYSLRMHPNITKCYTAQIDTPPPSIDDGVWRWVGLRGDWGYPMSIDGHIFRTKTIVPMMSSLPYKNVNQIEALLARNPPKKYPYMACSDTSSIINIPMNRVQTTSPNIHMGISEEMLNEKFLDGELIDIDIATKGRNESPHEEIQLEMI